MVQILLGYLLCLINRKKVKNSDAEVDKGGESKVVSIARVGLRVLYIAVIICINPKDLGISMCGFLSYNTKSNFSYTLSFVLLG